MIDMVEAVVVHSVLNVRIAAPGIDVARSTVIVVHLPHFCTPTSLAAAVVVTRVALVVFPIRTVYIDGARVAPVFVIVAPLPPGALIICAVKAFARIYMGVRVRVCVRVCVRACVHVCVRVCVCVCVCV